MFHFDFIKIHKNLKDVDWTVYPLVLVEVDKSLHQVSCILSNLPDRQQPLYLQLLKQTMAAVLNDQAQFVVCFKFRIDVHHIGMPEYYQLIYLAIESLEVAGHPKRLLKYLLDCKDQICFTLLA